MMVLSCNNIGKSFGIKKIFQNISFNIFSGDKIGIVGRNGVGKSTLMKILSGDETADEGSLTIGRDISIGYLKQSDYEMNKKSILEVAENIFMYLKVMEADISTKEQELKEKEASKDIEQINKLSEELAKLLELFKEEGGYTFKSRVRIMLINMGFSLEDFHKKVESLSGGEKTRLSLACLLLKKPKLLLLDEPTNHLDISTIKWLEQYLATYEGSLVIISHDRYFLNRITNRTIEIEDGSCYTYSGGYDFYVQEKKNNMKAYIKAYEKQQKEIRRQEEMIRNFKQRGTQKLAKRAASREKALEKIEVLKEPKKDNSKMVLRFKEEYQSGKDVLLAENLSKSFGYGSNKKELFSNLNLDIKRGEKICFVGENGVGKTTLFRIIKGELSQNEGYLKLGHNVKIAYYDQNQEFLNDDLTVLEELTESYRLYSQSELRGLLGMFLFRGDSINLSVRSLSGGQRARLSLLKLMMQGANLLILDEPTNHLDIDAKEVFEEAIMNFEGTVLIISHDRYLLSKVPDKIIEISQEGERVFLGKYDYYESKREEFDLSLSLKKDKEVHKKENNNSLSSKDERRLKKEKEREEKKIAREKEKLEIEINKIEDSIAKTEEELVLPDVMNDYEKLQKISDDLEKLRMLLEEKYEKWLQ